MPTRTIWDPSKISIATMRPTLEQRRLTLLLCAVVLAATAIMVPFGAIALRPMDGFIPATEAVIALCGLLIAVLLSSQAVTIGSRALLLLAAGFLFDALIVIPHALTFPGAFAPAGLLGAGLQTTAWLFIVWHFGLPAAVLGYVVMPREPRAVAAAAIYRSAAFVVALAALITVAATAYGDSLPALFVDKRGFTPLAHTVTAFDFSVSAVALTALLARRQKSVFDLWLTVAMVTLVAELAMTTFVIPGRFSLGFYVSRSLSLAASVTVLIALFAETIRQEARLARANLALELERSRKLTTLDAALGAITHEVKQPISSIVCNAEAAQTILEHPNPNLDDLREIAAEIVGSSFRANDIFRNIRGLYKNSREDLRKFDVNRVVASVVRGLRAEMDNCGVVLRIELASGLPVISGNEGQLQEVVYNLVHNAVDAMKASPKPARTLRVRTAAQGRDAVGISVQDSGPGIAPEQIERIFDPFVTTKKDGMGMGLAICRMIVERHGGQLSVSSSVGAGACFEIALPVETAAAPEQEPEEAVATVAGPPLFLRRPRRTDGVPVADGAVG